MRTLVLAAAFVLATGPALAAPKAAAEKPAGEATWIAICVDQDAQYTQTIGGTGFFHLGTGQRTYQTQKLVQSHFDGSLVCAVPDPKAPRADSQVAEICADMSRKSISVMSLTTAEIKKVTPQNATVFCTASITAYP
jgi:hypothetical protein